MSTRAGSFRSGPNRRRFLQGIAALAPLVGLRSASLFAEPDAPSGVAPGHTLFVGTQTDPGSSKGIYAYAWDPEKGSLALIGLAAPTPMPTFITPSRDGEFLFAANETTSFHGAKSGGVSSFSVASLTSPATRGKLSAVNSQASGGTGTCYVGLDHTGRVLLCANYNGGSASSFKVSASGQISPAVSHFQYTGSGPNHERQEAPHIHRAMASPGNKFALFNDLGLDKIHVYALDATTAKLTPHEPAAWNAPKGSGPRSLRFHPNGKWAYCVTEMGSSIIVLDWDEGKGTLTDKQQVSLVPAGFAGRSQASETAIDRAGRFLYAADRYYDGLYSFSIDPSTGKLAGMTRTPCAGKTPRYITLDPTERWLLVADQDSDGIEIFARDPHTGKLASHGRTVSQSKPQCLVFL